MWIEEVLFIDRSLQYFSVSMEHVVLRGDSGKFYSAANDSLRIR